MTKRHTQFALTVAALTASSLTFAHGEGSAGSTLYHYLSSPDHVITFFMLALAALRIGVWAVNKSAALARQKSADRAE